MAEEKKKKKKELSPKRKAQKDFNKYLSVNVSNFIKERIKERMEATGLSYADIAVYAGSSRQSIQYALTPNSSLGLQMLYKMCAVLGVEPRMVMPSLNQTGIAVDTEKEVLTLKFKRRMYVTSTSRKGLQAEYRQKSRDHRKRRRELKLRNR